MFSHSVKVPRLYKIAAKLARDVSEGKGSLKELVYSCKHPVSIIEVMPTFFYESFFVEFKSVVCFSRPSLSEIYSN